MRTKTILCLSFALFLALPACTTTQYVAEDYQKWDEAELPPDSILTYQVFLIGDAGKPNLDGPTPTLELLKTLSRDAGEQSAIIYLGDNLYCCGLPPEGYPERENAEAKLLKLIETAKDYKGRFVIIPGNHDWGDAGPSGLATVRRQERFIESQLGKRGNVFLPDNGFPGPVEVDLTERIRLIVIDTQWWLGRFERPFGDTGEYALIEDGDFLLELDDLIKRRDDEDVLVVGHHPLFSNGPHAGYYPASEHLFPFGRRNGIYVPLPLLGSLNPLFVRYFGSRQDLSHHRYKLLREALLGIFEQHDGLIYAAGHEHSLQYFQSEGFKANTNQHYIVSGAASPGKIQQIVRGRGATFAATKAGFSVLKYYDDGQIWMEMVVPKNGGAEAEVLFRNQLRGDVSELVDDELPTATNGEAYPDYSNQTEKAAINPAYADVNAIHKLFLGSHNRWAWATPTTVPVLDMGRDKGGLTPIKRGGGLQTSSLRMRGGDGKEYVLRTIDKDPSGTVPEALQGTVATDLVQDQIASLNPYGALIIPPLADAVNVYHTNPKLVYVPDDPRMGIYQEQVAGRVMLFEERPDEDQTDNDSFGNSSNVIGSPKLYRELADDNDHRVDQRWFARSRLFDLLIADWDRHRDQWRWASYEPYELDPTLTGDAREQGKIYRPIPRDRDFAFNRLNGIFPKLAPYFDSKFQDFGKNYGDISGLTKNGREQDRRFTNELTRTDWINIADSMKLALTDEIIDQAILELPEPIRKRDGDRIARLLKIRRDKLDRVARKYYNASAKIVDVIGSNKHERFEVMHLNDDATRVVVYKISKEGEEQFPIYERIFLHDETTEVRLYGLDGKDEFIIEGKARKGIRVRVIGGTGDDTFVDTSEGGTTYYYDTVRGEDTVEAGPDSKIILKDDPLVNAYASREYTPNIRKPQFFFGSNQDDGIFIGGGVQFIHYSFRKKPYGVSHRLVGNVAPKNLAFNIRYDGEYIEAIDQWDLGLNAEVRAPNNFRNFFGLGNETDQEGNSDFFAARLNQVNAGMDFIRRYEIGVEYRLGPTFEFTKVRQDGDRFLGSLPDSVRIQEGLAGNTFDGQWFTGATGEATFFTQDNTLNPRQGFRWTNTAEVNAGLRNASTFGRLSSELKIYYSPLYSPQLTLAGRVGAATNIGDFPFFHANTLGGKDNLRGYRSNRFAGRTHFFTNLEARLRLFRFSTYVAIGELGVLGFYDKGRIWTDGESSDVWHQGYGGGLWTQLFNMFVLTGTVGVSEEETNFTLKFGFFY